jgi:hypothetical protein
VNGARVGCGARVEVQQNLTRSEDVKTQLIFTGVAEKFKFILKISQTVVT